jgi:hypothetical protein
MAILPDCWALGNRVVAVVQKFDSINVWSATAWPDEALQELRSTCGEVMPGFTKRERKYRKRLFVIIQGTLCKFRYRIHQPTAATLHRLTALFGKHRCFINCIHFATDLLTATAKDAQNLFSFVRHRLLSVRDHGPRKQTKWFSNVEYTSNTHCPGMHFVGYLRDGVPGSDGKVRVGPGGLPSCRIEFRVQGLGCVRRKSVDVVNPLDLLVRGKHFQKLLRTHLRLAEVNWPAVYSQWKRRRERKRAGRPAAVKLPHPVTRWNPEPMARVGRMIVLRQRKRWAYFAGPGTEGTPVRHTRRFLKRRRWCRLGTAIQLLSVGFEWLNAAVFDLPAGPPPYLSPPSRINSPTPNPTTNPPQRGGPALKRNRL